jgi:hypothetical protein
VLQEAVLNRLPLNLQVTVTQKELDLRFVGMSDGAIVISQ